MKDANSNRTRFIGIRLKQEEYEWLASRCNQTTTPQLSEFVRRIIFDKRLTVKHRNQSLDDFMTEMIALRKELHYIGNNFNQAVRKLHTLVHVEEFRNWMTEHERDRRELLNQVCKIQSKINSIADEWLQ